MSKLDTLRRGLDLFPGEKDAPPCPPAHRHPRERRPPAPASPPAAELEKSCSASQAASASFSGRSMRSILKTTGRVPSLQQAIITRSSLVQPCMMEPPCSAV